MDGCVFDDATGAMTIISDFDWKWISWQNGDTDWNTIVTANIDIEGLNAGDSMYEDGWSYSAFNQMFKYCNNLVSVSISGAVSLKRELDLSLMFSDCENLKTADLRGFSGAKILNMYAMFFNCPNYRLVSRKNTSMYFSNGIRAKKKYYVRIRTYKTVNGRKIYSKWSKKKSVVTK